MNILLKLSTVGLFSTLFFLAAASPVAAAACDELYFIMNRYFLLNNNVLKIDVDEPDKAYQLAPIATEQNPQQPYLFRLTNGDFGLVYREKNERIWFKNISGGAETVVQKKRTDKHYSVNWPRAVQLKDGTIIVAFSSHVKEEWEACKPTNGCLFDTRIRLFSSGDNGRTWSLLSELTNSLTGDPGRGGLWQPTPIELSDGSLGLLINEQMLTPAGSQCDAFRYDATAFYVSTDKGKTWQRRASVASGGGQCTHYNEGSVIELPDGRLVTVMRTIEPTAVALVRKGTVQLTISSDQGRTWSAPKVIAEAGHQLPTEPGAATAIAPLIRRVRDRFVLLYNKIIPEGNDIFTVKTAINLVPDSWNTPEYSPAVIGPGAIGANCLPGGGTGGNPADLTDTGDTPGDEVNIFDYNALIAGFGTTYNIFNYNTLVGRFGE